jgi:hypothetical protein
MATIDPAVFTLAERFARECSDEYSAKVDRKDAVLDYILGKSDALPDMLQNSSSYAYKSIDCLEKLGKKEAGDVFFRATALLMHVASRHIRRYTWLSSPFAIGLGDEARILGLTQPGKSLADRLSRLVERLTRIRQFAGDKAIADELASRVGNCKFQNKSADEARAIVETMFLLKLYAKVENSNKHQFTTSRLSAGLPELLQAVLNEDTEQMQSLLHSLMEPLMIQRIHSKDNQSAAVLEPSFLQEKRDKTVAERFSDSSLNAKDSLSSQVFHQNLLLVASALLYSMNMAGGKAEFLRGSDEAGKLLLDAARTIHNVYPLEMRHYLAALDGRRYNYQSEPLEGFLSLEEPYSLIEQLKLELNSYSPSWPILKAVIEERPDRALRAYDLIRSPYMKAYLHKILSDKGIGLPASAGTPEESVFAVLRDSSEGGRPGLGFARYLDGSATLADFWGDQNTRKLFDIRNRDNRRMHLLIAVSMLPVESQPYRRLAILLTSPEMNTMDALSDLNRSFAFSGEKLLNVCGDDPEVNRKLLLSELLKLNGARDYVYTAIPADEYRSIIEQNLEDVIDDYRNLPTDARLIVLECAFLSRDQLPVKKRAALMAAGFLDSSKKAAALVLSQLSQTSDKSLYIELYKSEKKASVKELVLDRIRSLPDSIDVYQELLDGEKNSEWKELIQILMNTSQLGPAHAHAALADLADAKKLSRLSWVSTSDLPPLKGTDGSILDERIKMYILLQSADHTTAPNERLSELRSYADGDSLAEFAVQLVQHWIGQNAPAKEKWVLFVGALFGNLELARLLGPQIKEWTENSRGAMAADAVKALSYLKEPAALMIIDSIKRTVKNRQVKGAAEEALIMAAENQGLTPEQLEDRLVTSLGFDTEGTQQLSYGERTFRIKVNRELELVVLNEENGKTLKSLPAPGQKDDAELAAKAKATLAQLKKDLKTMVAIQALRLEESLSKQRLWSVEDWTSLFVANIIMQKFAVGLIWGVYENGGLSGTFRYMEDGSFNTVDEEEYELPSGAFIGLVHPLELEPSDLTGWKTQLEDYEIKQPFPQLDRDIHLVDQEERQSRQFDRLPAEEFSPTAFPKALEKYGWYKGAAMDGGWYTELYKEYGDLIAELRFSGTSISYYEGMEQITLEAVQFYRNKRNKYFDYSNQDGIRLEEVPGRIYSETIYDILRAAGR